MATGRMGDITMATARDIMHSGAECAGKSQTLQHAARQMRDRGVGALPVCGDDGRLLGIITDRDIVVQCLASGLDPGTVTVGELAQAEPITIDPSADVNEVLHLMTDNQIRRLPVTDKQQVVGMISEADLARNLPEQAVGQFVEAICAR